MSTGTVFGCWVEDCMSPFWPYPALLGGGGGGGDSMPERAAVWNVTMYAECLRAPCSSQVQIPSYSVRCVCRNHFHAHLLEMDVSCRLTLSGAGPMSSTACMRDKSTCSSSLARPALCACRTLRARDLFSPSACRGPFHDEGRKLRKLCLVTTSHALDKSNDRLW